MPNDKTIAVAMNDLKTRLKTGIPEMDKHHERLIEMFHEAGSILRSDADMAALGKIISELIAYSMYHFEAEESLMKTHGYALSHPDATASHIHQHRVFAGKVVAFRDDLKAGLAVDRWAVLDFLNGWLISHISTIDRHLADFIRGRTAEA